MRRGEVWWAELDPPAGRRPVLLVSRDSAYFTRSLIMAAPISTRIRGIQGEVVLGRPDGMPRRCAGNLDTIRTIPKASLDHRVAPLREHRLQQVDEALRYAFGLD